MGNITRLSAEAEGIELVNLNLKKVRADTAKRLRVLAAIKRWSLEYATDRVLQAGLDRFDEEEEE